jgi:hypothetical protein
MNKNLPHIGVLLISVGLMLALFCGPDHETGMGAEQFGSIAPTLLYKSAAQRLAIPHYVKTVQLRVKNSQGFDTIVSAPYEAHSLRVSNVPISSVTLRVSGLDDNGSEIYSGQTSLEVRANTTETPEVVINQQAPLLLAVMQPSGTDTTVFADSFIVKGNFSSLYDNAAIRVSINELTVQSLDGAWEHWVHLAQGRNVFTVTVADTLHNHTVQSSLAVTYTDTTAPTLQILTPNNIETETPQLTIQATAYDKSGIAEVLIGGAQAQLSGTLASRTVTLVDTFTTIEIVAKDSAQTPNSAKASIRVVYRPKALVQYSLTYQGNESTHGEAPLSSTHLPGESVVVAAPGELFRTGNTFRGWTRDRAGTQKLYSPSDSLLMRAEKDTLWAQWAQGTTYGVVYQANGGSGEVPIDDSGYIAEQTVLIKDQGTLTLNGHYFDGWSVTRGGQTKTVQHNDTLIIGNGYITLNARWKTTTLTVSFEKNDVKALGSMAAQQLAAQTATALSVNQFHKPGWQFVGWADSTAGLPPTHIDDGAKYTLTTTNDTLYAKWVANKFDLHFNKNHANATGTMNSLFSISCDSSIKLPQNTFANPGWSFLGWAKSASEDARYGEATNYTMDTTEVTLYAIWTQKPTHSIAATVRSGDSTGTILPSGEINVVEGESETFTIKPKEGYIIEQVLIDGVANEEAKNRLEYTFSNVTKNHAIDIQFTPKDQAGPAITPLTQQEKNRVTSATGQISFTIQDESGVDSVWYELNEIFIGNIIEGTANTYQCNFDLGSNYGDNILVVHARDNSPKNNMASKSVILLYNTVPSSIVPHRPLNGAVVQEENTAVLEWTGGTDVDGDAVKYQVFCGENPSSLNFKQETFNNTYSINSLSSATKYYWRVKLITSLDTLYFPSQSGSWEFTTANSPTTIAEFTNRRASISDNVNYSFSASDEQGIREYGWDFNADGITDITTLTPAVTRIAPATIGEYPITVRIIDNLGDATTRTITLTITNTAPSITGLPDTLHVGYKKAVVLSPQVTDDGQNLVHKWDFANTGAFIEVSNGDTVFTAEATNLPKTVSYVYKITDDDGNVAQKQVAVVIDLAWTKVPNSENVMRTGFALAQDGDNKLFLLGGETNSGYYNDIRTSTNAVDWTIGNANSPWATRSDAAALFVNNRLLLVGGWKYENDTYSIFSGVWSSDDGGISWDSLNDVNSYYTDMWGGHIGGIYDANLVAYKELIAPYTTKSIFMVGGNSRDYLNGVSQFLQSDNGGLSWSLAQTPLDEETTSGRGWFPAAVNGDTIWCVGGNYRNILPFQVTFMSTDGYAWSERASSLSLAPNYGTGDLIHYDGKLIFPTTTAGIVISADGGASWSVLSSNSPWTQNSPRKMRVISFQSKLWVFTDKGIWFTDTVF